MRFTLLKTDPQSNARRGRIETGHGTIETPIFMPVGTVGSVKGVYHRDLKGDIGAQIILGNTYHLYLRPGLETLRMAGGLHRFAGWDRPILTDSGGFQVFSLADSRKLTPEGCTFRSHIDGSAHIFTPENNVDTQRIIGADIIMALDECTPGDADRNYARKSLDLTKQWLRRGIARFRETEPLYGYSQAFFPIVQGCVYPDLRVEAAENVASYDCEGYAIGGLSVGEPTEVMYEMIEAVHPVLPKDRPRYLMGVGTPENLLEGIARGIDMFDCVMPTRNGRNGMLFTWEGRMNMRNKKWERHVLCGHRLHQGLSATSVHRRRDAGGSDCQRAQPGLLSRCGDAGPPSYRDRRLSSVERSRSKEIAEPLITFVDESQYIQDKAPRQVYHKEVHRNVLCCPAAYHRDSDNLRYKREDR